MAGRAGVRFRGGGFMIEPRTKQERGLRPGHKLTVVAAAVVAVLVAYVALHAIVGLIAFFIKTIIVLAVIGGVLYLVFRHAGRRSSGWPPRQLCRPRHRCRAQLA